MQPQIIFTVPTTIIGSDDLYRAVRAGFVSKGTTLSAWCKANGFNRQTAEKALKGQRFSSRARQLLPALIEAALAAEGKAV